MLINIGVQPPVIAFAAKYHNRLIGTPGCWNFQRRVTTNEEPRPVAPPKHKARRTKPRAQLCDQVQNGRRTGYLQRERPGFQLAGDRDRLADHAATATGLHPRQNGAAAPLPAVEPVPNEFLGHLWSRAWEHANLTGDDFWPRWMEWRILIAPHGDPPLTSSPPEFVLYSPTPQHWAVRTYNGEAVGW